MKKIILISILYTGSLISQHNDFIASWSFDKIEENKVIDNISGIKDIIDGNYKIVPGVIGNALKCDGFTTRITRNAENAPVIKDAFTIETWIAPQAYPWNWGAIINQEFDKQRGYFFGIDGEGRVGLHVAVSRQWRECISNIKVPFMEWSHIAGTFHPENGLKVYINGKEVAALEVDGYLLNDISMELQIGRNHKKTIPSSLNRAGRVKVPASYSFDGIIDELKIHSGALNKSEIEKIYKSAKTDGKPELSWRKLPQIKSGERKFGAYYTNLEYDEDWDALWKVDDHPDIVVTFEQSPVSMIFWRGTNYNMNLITENGIWIADQSAEGWSDEYGCCEHMSDKHNRYSHVRIIENTDARVVVHWRYALADITYQIANIDPITDWGDWADEYYYIYPGGFAIRHFAVHGSDGGYSITEPAVLSNPGEVPEDNCDLAAVTLSNLKGDVKTYSFETWPTTGEGGADFIDPISDPLLSVVNTKSDHKPFYIYEPGTRIIPYGGGIREIDYTYSHFHARNHWPVAQIPCDGRFVLASDRVTSSAITSPEPPQKRRKKDGALEGRFIMGLSYGTIEGLLPLTKSWLNPPKIEQIGKGYQFIGHDKNEHAFIFNKLNKDDNNLNISVHCSPASPLVNPVIIINNWGKDDAKIRLNDDKVLNDAEKKFGIRKNLNGDDLIVLINFTSTKDVRIEIE